MAKTGIQGIAEALSEALATADERLKARLVEQVEDFARRFPVTYHEIRQGKAPTALCYLFDAIIEGTDARPKDRLAPV